MGGGVGGGGEGWGGGRGGGGRVRSGGAVGQTLEGVGEDCEEGWVSSSPS